MQEFQESQYLENLDLSHLLNKIVSMGINTEISTNCAPALNPYWNINTEKKTTINIEWIKAIVFANRMLWLTGSELDSDVPILIKKWIYFSIYGI